jgi:alpha-L-fucosidase 2
LVLLAAQLGLAAEPPTPIECPSPAPLIFSHPIARWDEAIPIGNGLMGVLVWGGGEEGESIRTINLSLDRGDLWDTRLPETLLRKDWTYATMIALKEKGDHAQHVKLFDEPYDTIPYPTKLPAGRVVVTLPADVAARAVRPSAFALDLTTGIASFPNLKGESLVVVAKKEPIAIMGIESSEPMEVRILRPAGLDKLEYEAATIGEDVDPTWGRDGRRGVLSWMVQKTKEDLTYVVAAATGVIQFPDRKGAVVAVTIATSKDAADPLALAKERLRHVMTAEGIEEVVGGAVGKRKKAWAAAASISIPDAKLQHQYDLCKHFYLAGAAAGAPPMPLQGPWTADEGGLPPWKGDYHNDLNTQMTYLAAHEAGMDEQMRAWLDFNWELLPQYRKFAREFYGLKQGAVIPGVMTIDGKPMGGWGQYSLSPTNGIWVAQSFYLHWKYTGDEKFLRERAFPFCTEIGKAVLALMREDDRGMLRLPLSSSPEIFDNSPRAWLPPNSNYDLSLIRWLFSEILEMQDKLWPDGELSGWHRLRWVMDPLDIDPATHALTFAKGIPYTQSHRHFSHAMAIYPLGTLNIDRREEDNRTIAATIDQLDKVGTDWWCGYSFAWMSAMCARAGQSERALEYLTKYMAFTGPNGFHLNGDQTKSGLSKFTYRPFTLEGNFLAMQAMQEMLLQSWGGIVRVFPSVSEKWKDVSFRDLRGQDGLRVSAERRNGNTTRIHITSDKGGEIRLRNPFHGGSVRWNPAPGLFDRDTELLSVTLKPGETLEGEAVTP